MVSPNERSFRRLLSAVVALWLVAAVPFCPAQDAIPTDHESAEREFTLDVLPLLKSKCFGCHGEDTEDIKGEFDVTSREALLTGGESGDPAIIPGRPEESRLMEAVRWEGLEMPPKENDRLTKSEIATLHRWIQQGARWPDTAGQERYRVEARQIRETAEGVLVDTSGGTSDEWTYRRYQK